MPSSQEAMKWKNRSYGWCANTYRKNDFYPVAVMLLLCGLTAWAQFKPPLVPAPKPCPRQSWIAEQI
jgi:predicted small integral membrane protein